jgi:hypothetical protein
MQDQAQFAAIHKCNAKKKAKQEKEAKCWKCPSQNTAYTTFPSVHIPRQHNPQTKPNANPNTMPSHSTITTLIHWSHQRLSWDLVCLISNNAVIYGTLPPPLLIKTSP